MSPRTNRFYRDREAATTHYFAPHAVEVHRLRRRRAWAGFILLLGTACAGFVAGYFFPR